MSPHLKDADYPYSATNRSAESQQLAADLARRSHIWKWIVRTVVVGAALFAVTTLVVAVIAGRAALRARSITRLEQFGSTVWYEHQQSGNSDILPEALREKLGDRWFSEVVQVNHRGEEYFIPPFTFGTLTEADVGEICKISGSFPMLQAFLIATDIFSCRQIENWPRLAQLEMLDIESSKLNDRDLAIIGRMKGLKRLRIAKANFTAAGLQELASLPLLEDLTLEEVQLTPSSELPVRGFASLEELLVSESPEFDDKAIALFGSPPQLTTINFNRTPIGDRGLAQLLRSGKIKSLIISDGKLTEACTKLIAEYPAPGWLVLSRMPLTDSSLNAFSGKSFPTLILSHTLVTDEAFRVLNEIQNVDFVSFADSKVTGIGVNYLKPEITLDYLDVSGPAITSAGLRALAAAQIRKLTLDGAKIGDQELMLFVTNNQLTNLGIAQTQVSDQGLRAFYSARRRHFTKRGWEEHLTVTRDPFGNEDESFLANPIDADASEAATDNTTPVSPP